MSERVRDGRAGLVAATRELMQAVGVTDAPDEDMAAAAKTISELAGMLGERAGTRVPRVPFSVMADSVAAEPSEVVTLNRYNPGGIPLTLRFHSDGTATGRLTAGALLEGPPGCVHGGVSSYLMDCLFGSLVQAQRVRAYTGTLTLRYPRPTPLERPLELAARIERRDGRKLTLRGSISCDEVVTVEGSGLFIEAMRA